MKEGTSVVRFGNSLPISMSGTGDTEQVPRSFNENLPFQILLPATRRPTQSLLSDRNHRYFPISSPTTIVENPLLNAFSGEN